MQKRGQAAVEFVMTHGWAIMLALVAVGALAYYGVLNPDQFLPSTCALDFGILCADFKVQEEDVTVVLINGKWEDLEIININITGCTGTASGSLEYRTQKKFIISGCSNTESRKFTGEINVSYYGHSNLTHKNVGKIIARVEGGCGLCACQNIDTNCGNYPLCTNCNSQDNYGANYCSGNNIVRDFNDYSCSSNQCDLSAAPETVENCASNNGICQSAACVCADTASSCGTYPVCTNCGTNKMCYTASCLWDLNGEWILNYPNYGPKHVNMVQTGDYVEAILLESTPTQEPGTWALRFTITGDNVAGEENEYPYGTLPYFATIVNQGNRLDGYAIYQGNNIYFLVDRVT